MRLRLLAPLALALFAAAACKGGELDTSPAVSFPTGGTGGGNTGGSGGSGGGGGGGSGAQVFGPLGMRADLPVDGKPLSVSGLSAPVDVVRDTFGRPHLYASSVADAMRVEGYLVAQDRHVQLEILRRVAEGRMAALLGNLKPSLIDTDIAFRQIGLARVAKAQYGTLAEGSELKVILDAFADGVTQAFHAIKKRQLSIPNDVYQQVADQLDDWTGADSLAIGRLQTWILSYDSQSEMDLTDSLAAFRSTFSATSTDPGLKKRAGVERDLIRFQPDAPATTTTGYPVVSMKTSAGVGATGAVPPELANVRRALREAKDILASHGFGSNNWAISAARSASGHAMVASDPHLNLTAPAIFWPVSMDVTGGKGADPSQDLHVSGMAFPGIPGIILGNNAHIAWGATVAGYDVTDVYAETLTADGQGVTYQGKTVPLTTVDEVIEIAGASPLTYHVRFVPHHGPIFPTITKEHAILEPKGTALSVKWTGLEATSEIAAVVGLLRASTVDEARASLKQFGVGAQNWMLGDDHGDILWTSHARVPKRPKNAFAWDAATYKGILPCMVLPGDGSAEWGDFLADDLVPWAKNPPKGYLSTANNDPIGVTLDNDPSNDVLPDGTPMYLGCFWDSLREARVQERIEAHSAAFSPDDLASIQADVKSPLGARLVPHLLAAIDRAELERTTAGSAPDLATVVNDPSYAPAKVSAARALLAAWGTESDFSAESGVDPESGAALDASDKNARASQATLLFNAWLGYASTLVLGDELKKAGLGGYDTDQRLRGLLRLYTADKTTLATYDAATKDSALWDDLTTPALESRDERTIRAILAALAYVDALPGGSAGARWGQVHTVTFDALVPLFPLLSIPAAGDAKFAKGFPRHGDLHVIDASFYGTTNRDDGKGANFTYSSGPAQRFVAELDPAGPHAKNALPGGNVWDNASPHFRDEAELWRKNQTHVVPMTLDEVVKAKESRSVASSK